MADNTNKILEKILAELKANKGNNNATSRLSSLDNSNDNNNNNNGFVAKLIDRQLKNSAEYIRLQQEIEAHEEKLIKLKVEGNNQETISDRLTRNLAKLEQLRRDRVGKYTNEQKEARRKILNDIKAENKLLLEQEKRESDILELKKQQSEELNKITQSHKKLIAFDKTLNGIKNKYKKISNSDVGKKTGELLKDQVQELTGLSGGIFGFVSKTLKELWEQDSVMSKLSANYALSRRESAQLKNNIANAAIQTQLIGVSTSDLVKMQQSYTNEIGRSIILTEQGMTSLAEIGVATHLGAEGAANMAANMELFGYSAEGSVSIVTDLMKLSRKVGVSNSVTAKKFQDNLKLANSYTFKDGVKGVSEMSAYSTKLRINMQSIANFADKISSPEGAIQAAASLQVLGGSFASMSDPMRLLNQGITDIEGLTKTYAKMLDGVAELNKETGEVTINGYDRLRIKAASEAMGVSFDEMMTTARTQAKRKAIVSDFQLNPTLGNADENTKDLIASLAQYKKGKGWEINIAGKNTLVSELSPDDINALQPKDMPENLRAIAEATLGLSDLLQNAIKAFMQKIVSEMMPSITNATQYIANVIEKIFGAITGKGGLSNTVSSQASIAAGGVSGFGLGLKSASKGLAMPKGIANFSKGAKLGMYGKTALKMGGNMGARIPIIGSLISGGAEYLDSGNTGKAIGAGVGSGLGGWGGAAAGAALGSIVPGIGTVIGGLIGGIVGGLGGEQLGRYGGGLIDKGNDVLLPSQGKPVLLNKKDDVFAMKPGGAIVNALQPSSFANKLYNGVEASPSVVYGNTNHRNNKIDLNITGSLNLIAGNNATKISATELVKDRQFLRELTRIISAELNRSENGGKYMGRLGNNSF